MIPEQMVSKSKRAGSLLKKVSTPSIYRSSMYSALSTQVSIEVPRLYQEVGATHLDSSGCELDFRRFGIDPSNCFLRFPLYFTSNTEVDFIARMTVIQVLGNEMVFKVFFQLSTLSRKLNFSLFFSLLPHVGI